MQDRNKIVLVTGAAGFIGQHLCRHLLNSGFKVRTLLRDANQAELFPPEPELEHSTGDLLDVESLEAACTNIDVLVHLGGVAHVNNLAEDTLREINVDGTRNILQAAIRNDVQRVILMSSSLASSVETGKVSGTAYGRSKLAAEELVSAAQERGEIESVVLRPVNVYGAGMKGNIASMIALIGKGRLPPLPKTGTQISLVGVDDLVQAVILIVNAHEAAGKTYNVTDGISYSIAAIEESIYRAWGRKIPVWQTPRVILYVAAVVMGWLSRLNGLTRLRRIAGADISGRTYQNLVTDNLVSSDQLCEELGFKPLCNFYESLPDIVEFIDSQAWRKELE